MDYELNNAKRDKILNDNSTTIMRRVQINPFFMAELVKEGVLDSFESREIQAEPTPGKRSKALIEHLLQASVEQFLSFCIVLEVKQKRRDIVRDEFKLDIRNLQRQRDKIRAEREASSRSHSTAQGEEPMQCEEEVDEAVRDRILRQPEQGDPNVAGSMPSSSQPSDAPGHRQDHILRHPAQIDPNTGSMPSWQPSDAPGHRPGPPTHLDPDGAQSMPSLSQPSDAPRHKQDHIPGPPTQFDPEGAASMPSAGQPSYTPGQRQGHIPQPSTQFDPWVASMPSLGQPSDESRHRQDGVASMPPAGQPSYDARQRQEMPSAAPAFPNHPPSANLVTDEDGITSLSRSFGDIEIKEYKMLHDPTGETGISSLKANANWMTCHFERLRQSIVCKPYTPVVVALLDSGVFTNHPDFNERQLIIGSRTCISGFSRDGSFISDPVEAMDLEQDTANHGTMSAGILWQGASEAVVKILNFKVIKRDGHGSFQYLSEALQQVKKWDVQNPTMPVDIVLMTLGCNQSDDQTNRLLSELGEKKILVCSASNEGQTRANSVMSPANHGSVIAIGSCNENGDRCSHSAVGQELDFLFPGEKIHSTSSGYRPLTPNSRYVEKSGTSFAAPYGAALMALVLGFVESHIKLLGGMDGKYWRKALTKSSEMRKFLREVCCRREHSSERGYGAPEIDRIGIDAILAHLKREHDIRN